jgi:N6-L-threonylcarbamoyladenine synthase
VIILAIETSCDETAAAVLKDRMILSNIVFSQEKIHAKFGGIVPEVAARAHIETIIPVIETALLKAKIKKENLDAIALTCGPGLITSLMIGVDTAKTLAFVLNKPLVAVNHLEAHIYANWLAPVGKFPISNFQFPILCLIVSGGHTELVLMKKHLDYKLIGETRDDAAGEAFDKVAKLLNIGYPGGPVISRFAEKGNPRAYNFPRPMIDSPDFDFSFSGLKTDVLRLVIKKVQSSKLKAQNQNSKLKTFSKISFPPHNICDVAASFQAAVCDVLVFKTLAAAKKYKVKTIALAGGVAANKFLRQKMKREIKTHLPNALYLIPNTSYCTDNAAMIGFVGWLKAKRKMFCSWRKIKVKANWKIG